MSNANINRTGSSSSALQKIGFIVAVICFYGPHLIRGASGDFDEDNNIINCWTLNGQISLLIPDHKNYFTRLMMEIKMPGQKYQ